MCSSWPVVYKVTGCSRRGLGGRMVIDLSQSNIRLLAALSPRMSLFYGTNRHGRGDAY